MAKAIDPIDLADHTGPAPPTVASNSEKVSKFLNLKRQKTIDHEDYASREFWIIPIPKRCRFDPNKPFHFSLFINIVFGIASTSVVANLYYCQPILVELSDAFHVSYNAISIVPTLTQAGYATGLLFISPLGDLIKRRQLLLLLITCTMCLSIGLALAPNSKAFEAISYICGIFCVTPQVLLPLAADCAPAHRRASAMSIVLSGLLLGILVARVLSGIITQYGTFRDVYWMSCGLQACCLTMLYWTLPDYPRKSRDLSYRQIMFSLAKFAVTEPLLYEGTLLSLLASAAFVGMWVSQTFLLDQVYGYDTLKIGLFGLIGIGGVLCAPFSGRLVDKMGTPWLGVFVGLSINIVSDIMYIAGGGSSVGVIAVTTFLMDLGQQQNQTASSSRIQGIDPAARARMNAVFVIGIFIGQVTGTQAATSLYLAHGYRASGGFFLACHLSALLVLVVRGPNEKRYTKFGWKEGATFRKKKPTAVTEDGADTGTDKALEDATVATVATVDVENKMESDIGKETDVEMQRRQ